MHTRIGNELRRHAPFTALGALTGIAIMGALVWARAPASLSYGLFWTLHPLHVLLSALVTTSIFRLHGGVGFGTTVAVGYLGSIGIATFSDCLIPYLGEWLLAMPNRAAHIGFIEKWWLVNPLAFVGIAVGLRRPRTRLPHAGHVLLSTWASLFHVTLAMGDEMTWSRVTLVALFLFLAVWAPCCTSDIAFPLILVREKRTAPRKRRLPEASTRSSRDRPTKPDLRRTAP
jgi:hypothetical protein